MHPCDLLDTAGDSQLLARTWPSNRRNTKHRNVWQHLWSLYVNIYYLHIFTSSHGPRPASTDAKRYNSICDFVTWPSTTGCVRPLGLICEHCRCRLTCWPLRVTSLTSPAISSRQASNDVTYIPTVCIHRTCWYINTGHCSMARPC